MSNNPTAAIRSLHNALTDSITTVEALASECAEMAYIAEQEGHQGFADTLRVVSQTHRIRALEIGGRRAVLSAKFPNVLQSEE